MNINYYRRPNLGSEAKTWRDCLFSSKTDLSRLTVNPLFTLNGQPILRQHHATYLTGKETCRAHHFAKMMAAHILAKPDDNKVLWIDSIYGPHVCASIYNELAAHAADKDNLCYVCLDILGQERDNFYALNRYIEAYIDQFKPTLVVIDDIDHLMPFCGVNVAKEFCSIVRDVTNHTQTAFLFIGYNNLGKKASTTGNLGKYLFINTTEVFSLSTQREVTTVSLVRSYDLSRDPYKTQYHFTIGPDNMPHQADALPKRKMIDDSALQDIIPDVLQPGQTVTPQELLRLVAERHRQMAQQGRADDLVTRALQLNLLQPSKEKPDDSDTDGQVTGRYTLKTDNTLNANTIDKSVNTSLTLPTPPQQDDHCPVKAPLGAGKALAGAQQGEV